MKSQIMIGHHCHQHTPLMGYSNTSQTAEPMEVMVENKDKDVEELFVAGSGGDRSKQAMYRLSTPPPPPSPQNVCLQLPASEGRAIRHKQLIKVFE
jgi:hypothetical protein